ncbi:MULTISPECIES: alpha-ketoglutarate-dependent dioxygenase AlkB [unclassified Modicisalibacter]|uniref:alpha-ketoglutarate-dependent dioxygenase AlkB family protein n=1 Tax=unclassified Modicisalibacter TaxID=2679913 RepID=UPI001CCA9C58|nr:MULTISPECIES: alpha-ketoglutarate-dependent dioxygenase AlkB [unclassified Modicisalibacter]MBZ9556881.1 alpha-ketoglutarate-dependent dioxygenase AlkB [Modicisalibacter sp. R2A 31.J]MBZ9574458.1 alpha-ketoglutarate-dependent dioxygenase AlkB [Modicisalibacter sp. MOD 31.J]
MTEPNPPNWQRLLDSPPLWRLDGAVTVEAGWHLLERLDREIPWETPTLTLYGRRHPIPRSQCWMGDAEARYRYSGQDFAPRPWHPAVKELGERARALIDQLGVTSDFNSVLLNRYRDGDERMGWHADDEPELGHEPVVAALSLGAERPLRFRRRQPPRDPFNVWLPHASLLVMGAGVQECLQHALLPRAIPGLRISLTFRRVMPG